MTLLILIAAMCGIFGPPAADAVSPVPVLKRSIALPGVTGRIDHMDFDPATKRLFIAALGNGSLEIVDVEKGERIKTIDGLKEPQGVVFVPQTGQIVVSSGGDGTVRAFDAKTFAETTKVVVGDDADNIRLDEPRGELVVGYGDGALAFLDFKTLKTLGTAKLSGHPESFQIDTSSGRVFVNIPGGLVGGGGEVAVVDGPRRTVTGTWKLKEAGRNFPMALDAANKRLFVGCRRDSKLLVLDTDSGTSVAAPACVGDADDVFIDAASGQVLISGGDGSFEVYSSTDHRQYVRTASIVSAPGARTSLLERGSHCLFVAAPQRGAVEARILEYTLDGSAGGETGK